MPKGLTPSERRPDLDRRIERRDRPRTLDDDSDERRRRPRGPLDSLTPEAGLGLVRSIDEGDERVLRARVAPGDEEEPILIPGDPTALGARGRRRQNTDDESPVLRRALLGV